MSIFTKSRAWISRCCSLSRDLSQALWCIMVWRVYRKIPVISPGLIQFRKGFWVGLYTNAGAYIQGGGGVGAYKRN